MAFLNYSVLSKDTQALSSNAFTASKSFHLVDTEGNAANDQIDTINGGVDGGFLILQISSAGRDSWLIEGGGNVEMQVDANFQLNDSTDTAMFIYNGNTSLWCEIARSDNHPG